MVELVDDRIELRDPRLGAGEKLGLPRASQRLVAEAGQRERDQIADRTRADLDSRGFRDEPLGTARDFARLPVSPEVIAGLACGKIQTVAGGEGPFGVRPAPPREHQHVIEVDEAERRHTGHDILHEQGNPVGVVNHAPARAATLAN